VPPLRVLAGPNTGIRGSVRGHARVGVDPVHNLLIVTSRRSGVGRRRIDADLRSTANGNVKPKSIITGPRTDEVGGGSAAHAATDKGFIIAGCGSASVCAWSINDKGNVPPRWKIPVQQITGVAPSGIALDPAHKESSSRAATATG